jgi:hypothetical protein
MFETSARVLFDETVSRGDGLLQVEAEVAAVAADEKLTRCRSQLHEGSS